MADEKKDVLVPSAGNKKLQPGLNPDITLGELWRNEDLRRGYTASTWRWLADGSKYTYTLPPTDKLPSQVAAAKKETTTDNGPKWKAMDMATGKQIPVTEKKDPTSGPPVHKHRGIKPSRVNDHIKNSSFGRGVPFSLKTDYGSLWKNTSRLASVAIGDGNSDTTKFGFYHAPCKLNGLTLNGFSFNGAFPSCATQSTSTGMAATFHILEDEDQ